MYDQFLFYYSSTVSVCHANTSFSFKMSSSLCPHLVQEYFERVSEILTTYRSQILKQVLYDKISENLVLRGAVRQEEHERIFQCQDSEGQVSQMLVVIQNRMWGLENLLAAFMEEHINTWLTQEMFRAYMEHLAKPLKKQRESQRCECVQISNSILYRGWVNALKSLDSWIYKTGTSLGFLRQTLHPTDNMLAFLNDKLAEYTGGDSTASKEELVPYGFASSTSGEVQVAELEEDDINDLISLSETLSIAYHAKQDDDFAANYEAVQSIPEKKAVSLKVNKAQQPIVEEPTSEPEKKVVRRKSKSSRPPVDPNGRRRSTEETPSSPIENTTGSTASNEKRLRQRELTARLSAPKAIKQDAATPATNSPVRLRHSNSIDRVRSQERPKSAEFHRAATSVSTPSPTPSPNHLTNSVGNLTKSDKNNASAAPTTGRTTGFVRSKSTVPSSPKSRASAKLSSKPKPTGVTKPNLKSESKQEISDSEKSDVDKDNELLDNCSTLNLTESFDIDTEDEDFMAAMDPSRYIFDENEFSDDASLGISSLLLKNTILAPKEQEGQDEKVDYYRLSCIMNLSDDED